MLDVSTLVLELAQAATRAGCMRSAEVSVEGFLFVGTCKYFPYYIISRVIPLPVISVSYLIKHRYSICQLKF
jgi:hypothetical protein